MANTSSPAPAQASGANTLQLAEAIFSQLPLCAQAAATQGVSTSTCGLDAACLCNDDTFLSLLEAAVEAGCSAADGQKTLALADQLCTAADPSMNDSRAPVVIGIIVTIMTLASVSVVARIYSRKLSGIKLSWDDYLIMVALVFTLGLNAAVLYGVHLGLGKHIVTLSLTQITDFAQTYWATQLIFACASNTIKISILAFYLRIFPSRRFRNAAIIVGAFVVAGWISLIFSVVFSCHPVQYYWDKSISGGSCININTLSYGITGAGFITDLMVLLLPLPSLWKLQMQSPRKVAIIGIFILGGFVCVAAIVRLPLLLSMNQSDLTWTAVEAGLWINTECNLGIVCACLPIMRPLFRAVSPMVSLRSYLWKYSRGTSRTGSTRDPRSTSTDMIVSVEGYSDSQKERSIELQSQRWRTADVKNGW
ncbi:hypothetical protein MMC34_005987 [Xylographa carneopallida]|nr:hypothetical protein [Xylographa carneopallida]